VPQLSQAMRRQWQDQGFLHLRNVIPREEIVGYRDEADEVIRQHESEEPGFRPEGAYVISQALFRTGGLDGLMDHPALFGTILDLMGPYLQIMGSEIYVRYPGDTRHKWHIDAGRSLGQMRIPPNSLPLTFKIQFFLTDIPEEDHANFCLVPGSHRTPMPDDGRAGSNWGMGRETPPGGIQMIAEAGDCAIFPNTLWHSVAPNHSENVRRSFTLRYGQMWTRPFDYEKCPEKVLARMTARRRRMMGDLGSNYTATDYFKPKDQIEVIMDGLEFECPHV
jgi:hypothetical protein